MIKTKNGISLIVLVITIIVMIILAAAVIISLENAGIIKTAHNAVCMTNIKQAQNLAVLVWSNIYTNPDEYTMDNVEQKLKEEFEKNGLKYEDYNVEVTKNGIEVSSKAGCTDTSGVEGGNGDSGSDTIPTNWDYAYAYDRTQDKWTTITVNDGTEPTGDLVVRMYKIGTGDIAGIKVDTFDMLVTGNGDLTLDSDSIMINVEGAGEAPAAMLAINLEIGEGITSIGEYSFAGNEGDPTMCLLKSVKLPNSLKTLGNDAFAYQGNLEKVEFGTGLQTVSEGAFDSCIKLKQVELPEGLTTIGERAFDYCMGLETIDIPDTVTTIGDEAFANCTSLKEIIIPKNVTILDGDLYDAEGTFKNCTALTKATILGNLTSWQSAFEGCTALKQVELADTIKIIDAGAFEGCSALESIDLPSTLTKIGGSAFYGCSSLESVVIPNTVTEIGSSIFYNCTNLKNVKLSSELTELASYFFKNCTSLQTIYMGNKITKINYQAFYECDNFTLNYTGTKEQWDAIEFTQTMPANVTMVYEYTGN